MRVSAASGRHRRDHAERARRDRHPAGNIRRTHPRAHAAHGPHRGGDRHCWWPSGSSSSASRSVSPHCRRSARPIPARRGTFSGNQGSSVRRVVRRLADGGLSLGAYAAILAALDLARPVVAFALALLLVGRKTVERMALVVALGSGLLRHLQRPRRGGGAMAGMAARGDGESFLRRHGQRRALPLSLARRAVRAPLDALAGHRCGRLVPPRPHLPRLDPRYRHLVTAFRRVSQLVFWGIGLGAQIYRFRKVSDTVQRQQTKWVVYGFGLLCAGQCSRSSRSPSPSRRWTSPAHSRRSPLAA